jgi:hypothetical protein
MLNDSSEFNYHHSPVPVPPAPKQVTEKKSPAGKVPWGPWVAVLYALAVYILSQATSSMLLVIYPHLRGWDKATANDWLNTSIVAQFWFVLVTEALTFGAIWWFVNHRKSTLRAIGWHNPRWKDLLYMLVGFGVYFATYAMLLGIATNALPWLNVTKSKN